MSKMCNVCGGLISASNEVLGYGGPMCSGPYAQYPSATPVENPEALIKNIEDRPSSMTLDDKKLSEIFDDYGIVPDPKDGWYPETISNFKTALNRYYGELLMEIIGAAENDMPSWSSGKLAGESKHAKDARIRNQLRAELTASLKQRLGL